MTDTTTPPQRLHSRSETRSKLLSVQEAQCRVLAGLRLAPSDEIDLSQALGRVCGQDIYAKLTHPPAAVSAMDGYACCSKDVTRLPARLRKIGISRAGERFQGDVAASTCVRIFTGAIIPEGADVIALQEDAVEIGEEVEIREAPAVGKHIRRAGLDFAAGEVCLTKGRALTARDIGLLAACGHARVPVRRRPTVAILSTGDELVAPGDAPSADQIVGSNGAGLAAAVTAWGATPVDLGIVPDSIETIAAAVEQAKDADMLVTTGGASVGDHDLVQASLARRGFVSDFWRIAMRPGKPLLFGWLGELPILGLPGNPVSALVCALIFLRPALRTMLDIRPTVPNFETAILGAGMAENDQREDYVRARLELNGGRATAFPFPAQDSSMLMTLAKADALIRRRPFAPPASEGAEIEIMSGRQTQADFWAFSAEISMKPAFLRARRRKTLDLDRIFNDLRASRWLSRVGCAISPPMDEEGAIAARIRGQSIEKIAKTRRVSVAEVRQAFDRFCDRTLNPDARRHGLAFELARLDRLLEACWPKAVGGDLAAIAVAEKLSARRCVMLGLHAPTTAILKIIDESAPHVTSTQELEATLDALTEDGPADGQVPN